MELFDILKRVVRLLRLFYNLESRLMLRPVILVRVLFTVFKKVDSGSVTYQDGTFVVVSQPKGVI